MSQLAELSIPFPKLYVHGNPSGGGQYVKHHAVTQRLLIHCGPFSWQLVEILRGYVAAIPPDPKATSKRGKEGRPALDHAVVGAVWRLTVTIDERQVVVESTGDCEDPHNWPHDGARLKDAESDAKKRCASHTGLGLHLWAQDEYFLRDKLKEHEAEKVDGA